MRSKLVIAYDGTPEAGDGLALGAVLADLRAAGLIVALVIPRASTEATERAQQAEFHTMLQETREAAAELLGDRPFEVWPVFGETVAAGVDGLAADQAADLVVFGSPQHGAVGRALLGTAGEAAGSGAPCAVAVAPPGFRNRGALDPPVIGIAFDGSAEADAALDVGLALARAAGATLRLIGVEPAGWSRPIRHHQAIGPEMSLAAAELGDGVEIETRLLRGDPARMLARETETLGLLVCGSRPFGPIRRVMLGSVSTAVIRLAACPVVVVPRRVAYPAASPLAAASSV